MKQMSTTEERKMRVDKTFGLLRNLGAVDYVKALGMICYEFGVQRAKAVDYLDTLRMAGKIKIENGKVIA